MALAGASASGRGPRSGTDRCGRASQRRFEPSLRLSVGTGYRRKAGGNRRAATPPRSQAWLRRLRPAQSRLSIHAVRREAPRGPDASATGSETADGHQEAFSGKLWAAGSPESDDRRSPRGTGRVESGARQRALQSPSRSARPGDQEAVELGCDGPVEAVRDGAPRGGFGGSAEDWLTLLRCVSEGYG